MQQALYRIAKIFWPELENLGEQRRIVGVGNVFFFLYTLPLTLLGTAWLIRVTDWRVWGENWPILAVLAGLMLLFAKLNFFTIVEIQPGTYANADSSFSGVILWSGLLLFGPSILWIPWAGKLIEVVYQLSRATSTASRWVYLRIYTLYNAAIILTALVSITVYQRLGGSLPIGGLMFQDIGLAFGAITLQALLFGLVYSGFILYIVWAQNVLTTVQSRRRILVFLVVVLGLPFLAYPFGILSAGIYVQNSLFTYLFFTFGLCLVSLLARELSRAAESSRQQSRQLEQLEMLSRDIINGPPNASGLSDYLQDRVPVMFPSARVVIWLERRGFLLSHPENWRPGVERFWEWLQGQPETRAFEADVPLPWRDEGDHHHSSLVVAPILAVESGQPIGAIYIELQNLVLPWTKNTLASLFPAVNSLAAQVASALRQAEVYEEALELSRTSQELEFASEIQASFLPDKIPRMPGWELAVTILPAREMAGDFFDFIPFEDGRLGILIADVTDKGVGPALYMALSRTLIRTYAIEYEFDPDTVFFAANGRILKDARARLFVTAFFGILDQETGVMKFSNAGHNPPYLLRAQSGEVESLGVTGMPIGIDEQAIWEQDEIQLEKGDALILYTDGVPDTLNESGDFFEVENMLEIARSNMGNPAFEIQAAIIDQVHQFMGAAPQVDDITLIVLTRDLEKQGEQDEPETGSPVKTIPHEA